MQQVNGDRRVRKTKAQLRQGFTSLLREKSVKDITVKELTDLTDMNRGTFYCHYRDIYDMAAQIENEMFEEFLAVMDAYPTSALRVGIEPVLRDVFRFISKHADMCVVLLGAAGDNAFLQRLKLAVYERVMQEWGELYGLSSAPNRDYYMSFLVEGFIGLLQSWVKRGREESPEEMAVLAARLIVHGIQRSDG